MEYKTSNQEKNKKICTMTEDPPAEDESTLNTLSKKSIRNQASETSEQQELNPSKTEQETPKEDDIQNIENQNTHISEKNEENPKDLEPTLKKENLQPNDTETFSNQTSPKASTLDPLQTSQDKCKEHTAEILEVILGDYLPENFGASPVLTKNSTEKAAIVLEALLLERK